MNFPARIRKLRRWIVAGLILLPLAGFAWSRHQTEKFWQELSARAAAAEVSEQAGWFGSGPVRAWQEQEGIQTGHFRLPGGDLWQFAFLPHWDGSISRCVFRGPSGAWRVEGSKFCCEVILPVPPPQDSAALLAFLREGGASVEPER